MSSKVIAKPPSACCARGFIHEGEPAGKITKILDVDTYIATPSKPNGNIIFYFPDVFGHFVNSHLICDGFAEAGYHVFAPDYFRGDPITKYKNFADPNDNPDFDILGWAMKKKEWADPWVPKFVEEISKTYGKEGTKYGCTGYCFGAPYVCDQLSAKGICTAGAFAHPAFLDENHFESLTSGSEPLFLSCSEIDMTFPKELRRKAVDIMDEKKKVYHVQLFHGVSHGFALRADLSDPWQKYAKEESFQGITAWFDHWLS